MLARLKSEGDPGEGAHRRGILKVYFGYAAGVGKTYAMLQEARRLKAAGVDVVAGYVEPHGRAETEALLEGLEQMPPLEVRYRGATLKEFDLDAALARRPEVILVDELAHSNPPELRHAKRWQDVEELLQAGIEVHTTCNVQHVESLNDVVAQVSGVVVRETVPDDVFNRADEVALIDIPPEDLLERLKDGKVYIPAQAERALKNFFRRENLVALRELALRRTAERVHADVQTARLAHGGPAVWPVGERLLVCVGPSPTSAKVIRAAKRLANSLQAELIAVHVENAATERMSDRDRARLLNHLRLAERLGAETVTLTGPDPISETLDYARQRNVTKLVIGTSEPQGRWPRRKSALTDRFLRESGDIDVYVIRGAAGPQDEPMPRVAARRASPAAWWGTAAVLAACTVLALAWKWLEFTEANVVMTYLLGVVVISARFGKWPSVMASVVSVLLFDVLFTEPYFTVVVHDTQYLVTFAVMLAVGLATAALTARIRAQAELSRRNQRRTDALYRLGRKLAGISGHDFLAAETERAVAEMFGGEAVVFVPRDGQLRPILDHRARFAADEAEIAVAQWVFDHGEIAGRGTDTLPAAAALYLPMASPNATVGVLAVRSEEFEHLLLPEARSLLEAFAAQVALAVERDQLTLDSQAAHLRARSEELRSALLSSVSHDIRTPLAVIAGASSSLAEENGRPLDQETRRELLRTIQEEADALTRLVENLLRLTQLQAGRFQLAQEWHPVEDVIGSALHRARRALGDRHVNVELPTELLWGHFDAVLIEQALVNLLENAARYTPTHTPVTISGQAARRGIVLEVADRGPGIEPGDVAELFVAFHRGRRAPADSRGVGLGLAICKAIMEAHGGAISVRARPGGGAVFRCELPSEGRPPE